MDKKEIEQLRDSIKQKLENAEFEGRIEIDKDVLEQLLFDSYAVYHEDFGEKNEITTKTVKIPVWSGKFLQKIDLSEVDFTDVYWSMTLEGINGDRNIHRYDTCDYSNTNANIDLGKAFSDPVKHFRGVTHDTEIRDYLLIGFCNFENVDLSKSNLDGKLIHCSSVNFKNTNIKFNNTNVNAFTKRDGCIESCIMDNTDLSNLTVPFLQMMDPLLGGVGGDGFLLNSCRNSGLKIVCNEESLNVMGKDEYDCFDTPRDIEGFFKGMRDFFDEYDFVGCYFNGTLIESKEQLIELSTNTMKKLINEYNKTSTEYKMNQLLNSIDKQIESKKKKDINDMINDKVEMIESSIDEQIKSKQ